MMVKKVLAALSLAAFCVSMVPAPADAASAVTRIKDIAKVDGRLIIMLNLQEILELPKDNK